MIFFDKIKRVIERPERLLIGIQLRWAYYTNNQKLLIKVLYRLQLGKKLNLDFPKRSRRNSSGLSFMTTTQFIIRW